MPSKRILILVGLAWAFCALLLMGCASNGGGSASGAAARAPEGSKLWAQNCIRCHNSRSPTSYSETQWEVTMLHMRIRANLTAEEHKAILAFLKSTK